MTRQLKNDLKAFFTDESLFQNEFYLKCPNMNTYQGIQTKFVKMFDKGNGGELFEKNGVPPKAAAIHSSSMLAYNFFSWINEENPFIYDGVKYDKVVFEEKLLVLDRGTSDLIHFPQSNAKANMDVVLAGRDLKTGCKTSLLFIESKFTEHLSNAKGDLINMALSYSTPKCYFEKGNDWAELVDSWKEKANSESKKGYYNGIKQDICHLISLSALMDGFTLEWFNKKGSSGDKGSWLNTMGISLEGGEEIKFRNIIFSPAERYALDFNDTLNYRELYGEFEKDVQEIIPGELDLGFITYADLWRDMKHCIKDKELKKYLEGRYITFQEQ